MLATRRPKKGLDMKAGTGVLRVLLHGPREASADVGREEFGESDRRLRTQDRPRAPPLGRTSNTLPITQDSRLRPEGTTMHVNVNTRWTA
jgi:hypothetical protein